MSVEAKLLVDRKPFQGWKIESLPAAVIPDADRESVCMLVEYHPNLMPCNETRLRIFCRLENGLIHQLVIDLRPYALCHLKADKLPFLFDHAQKGWCMFREIDLT